MKKYRFSVLIERDEDGYLVATVPVPKRNLTQRRKGAKQDAITY
jgi:predicted RNase H-like HicB family nuclease